MLKRLGSALASLFRRLWRALVRATRLYFVAGLLAFAPIGITLWAIAWIIERLDNLLLPPLLQAISPGRAEAPDLPPLVGLVFTFVVILVSGVLVRHLFGHEVVRLWERVLQRVPVARTIYGGVKQLIEAVFQSGQTSFNRVVLIEFPRKGVWALGFTTGVARGVVQWAVPDKELVNVFVPTTPNPTSGFYVLVAQDELTELDLSVEDAFKLIMSAGLVTPVRTGRKPPEIAIPPLVPASDPGSGAT